MALTTDPVLKFGRNADIDVGTEDVWDGGGTWVQPTVARLHAIKSTDAKDTSAGVGARTVKIYGLSSAYEQQSETVILNGTANVNTANTYIMIHRMQVLTVGSEGDNAGTITATAATDGTVTAQISIGENQTLMAIYQIPAGYTGEIHRYYASTGGVTAASTMSIRLQVKDFGAGFCTKHVLDIVTTGGSILDYAFDEKMPLKVGEKAIIKVTGTAGAANMIVSAGFDIKLIPILS